MNADLRVSLWHPDASPYQVHRDGHHIGFALPYNDGTWHAAHFVAGRRRRPKAGRFDVWAVGRSKWMIKCVGLDSLSEAVATLVEMDDLHSPERGRP